MRHYGYVEKDQVTHIDYKYVAKVHNKNLMKYPKKHTHTQRKGMNT